MAMLSKDGIYFEYKETECPRQEQFYPHLHGAFEFYYFWEGDVEYIVGESVYRLQKNDLLVIRPTVYHYPRICSGERYVRLVFNFPQELYPADLTAETLPVRIRLSPNGRIARAFSDAIYAVERFSEEDSLSALHHLLNMIFLYLRYDVRQESERTDILHPLLNKILRYIDDNLGSPFDLNDLARRFFISPSWLTHMFKKHLHISVMQYITRKKILYAQALIRSGATPTEAAKACSLGNYSTFYRQYKRYLGINPKEELSEERPTE